MKFINHKGQEITISSNESELDIQFDLVRTLKRNGCRCFQNCTISLSLLRNDITSDMPDWKIRKIGRQTARKMFIDIFAFKGDKICVIEMKRSNTKNTVENMKRTLQVSKYGCLGFPIILCEGRKGFPEVFEFFGIREDSRGRSNRKRLTLHRSIVH